ncbi:hypothetical protein DFJ73DRAFT_10522 [Zopfochytrium polystomum]|nr:hypothetical protein DFJ73DRAFT_10522 [Zopfochytrium polystomum]
MPTSPSRPPYPFYAGAEKGGFAFPTVSQRWPVIITAVIDDIHRTTKEVPVSEPTSNLDTSDHEKQAATIISKLSTMKYDIEHGKPISPLNDGFIWAVDTLGNTIRLEDPSTKSWNAVLESEFPGCSYYSASWLFAECYMYRRIYDAINAEALWRGYDPFLRKKKEAFRESFDTVLRAGRTLEATLGDPSLLRELLVHSLWGNATDLSMFAGLSVSEKAEMAAGTGEKNIVANHLDQVVSFIQNELEGKRIDFILDNSGVELFYDLLLADHLHQTGRASKTVFHCKPFPWFVSDTTPADFGWLLDALENPASLFIQEEPYLLTLSTMVQRWRSYLAQKQWVITSNPVWCTWKAHRDLADSDGSNGDIPSAQLWMELQSMSSLLIFKGDLNYRKLVYDCKFPVETPFSESLGDVFARVTPPLVALRTNKSDTCVGLAPGKEAELISAVDGNSWRWNGKYAVVQFHRGFKMA